MYVCMYIYIYIYIYIYTGTQTRSPYAKGTLEARIDRAQATAARRSDSWRRSPALRLRDSFWPSDFMFFRHADAKATATQRSA